MINKLNYILITAVKVIYKCYFQRSSRINQILPFWRQVGQILLNSKQTSSSVNIYVKYTEDAEWWRQAIYVFIFLFRWKNTFPLRFLHAYTRLLYQFNKMMNFLWILLYNLDIAIVEEFCFFFVKFYFCYNLAIAGLIHYIKIWTFFMMTKIFMFKR